MAAIEKPNRFNGLLSIAAIDKVNRFHISRKEK